MNQRFVTWCNRQRYLKTVWVSGQRFGLSLSLIVLFLSTAVLPPLLASGIPKTAIVQTTANAAQLEQQATQAYDRGRFSEAADLWQQLATALKAVGDQLGEALALSNLSLTYQQLSQWQQATATINTSLKLIQNSKLKTQDSQLLLAQALDVQGRLQIAQGQAEAALATWRQAATFYRQQQDRTRLTRNHINQAQALRTIGLYRQAQALLIDTTQTLQAEPNTLLKATGLRSLGNVLRVVGDLEQSRQALEQSLAIAQQLSHPQAIGEALLSLGNTARAQHDQATARQFYQQAAATAPSINTRVQSQLNQLNILLEDASLSAAQALILPIQTQLEQLPLSHTTIQSRINFAQSLMKLKRQEALNKRVAEQRSTLPLKIDTSPTLHLIAQMLAQIIQQAKSLGDIRSESYAVGTLGELYEQTQQWTEASRLTQQALLLAQGIKASEIAYRWQWQLGRLFKQQEKRQAAIAAYDATVNTLQSLRYDLVAMNPDVQFSFREAVEPVYREFVDLLLQTGKDDRGVVSPANLLKGRDVIERLQLAEVSNFLREACLDARRDIDSVIDQPDKTAAAIYPILLPDRLEVILKLPQQPLRHHAVAIGQTQVETVIEDLRQDLRKPHTQRAVQSLSGQLYDWLIRPIAADLANSPVKTLVFVLDGNLRSVPMSVLYDGKQYLIEKYSVALTPGLQLINPQPLRQRSLEALIAGVSEFRPPNFPALPHVSSELQEIHAEVSSRVLLNQQFTAQTLQNQIATHPFPVIHLATHGQFSSNADSTFILAWDQQIKANALDALLRSKKDAGADAIELLVLSACQTATGDKRAALGIAGVVVRAGARSTLASLWNVNDASTAFLMSQFYRVIASRQTTKAEALRQAQLALLKHPQYDRPLFWAPYVLVGNWL